jgi:2-hydroxychromene-2-carboxylate isomerase
LATISLLVILQEMKHVPFADKPATFANMWRDVERRAAMYGIPAQLPALVAISSRQSACVCAMSRDLMRQRDFSR